MKDQEYYELLLENPELALFEWEVRGGEEQAYPKDEEYWNTYWNKTIVIQEKTTEEIIQLKEALTWEQIIKEYSLKKSYENERYTKISCVFHEEKTPSLVLYHKTKTYKCFGCGEKGDVLDFLSAMEEGE